MWAGKEGGPEGKRDKQLMWSGKQKWTLPCLFLFIFFPPRLSMISVSDVDKCSHSQFISSCLARGCPRQHPLLITSEAWGAMLGGGKRAQDYAAAESWPVPRSKGVCCSYQYVTCSSVDLQFKIKLKLCRNWGIMYLVVHQSDPRLSRC